MKSNKTVNSLPNHKTYQHVPIPGLLQQQYKVAVQRNNHHIHLPAQ